MFARRARCRESSALKSGAGPRSSRVDGYRRRAIMRASLAGSWPRSCDAVARMPGADCPLCERVEMEAV